MGIASKGILLFNTIKYLKPSQIFYQALHCVRPQDRFIKYRKKPTKVSEYSLWIEELDQEQKYVERFQPEELLSGKLTLLNESRSFDGWYYEDASHLWNFNVHYLEYLVALVGKAKITQEKKYIESVNEMFEDWHANGAREKDSNQAYTISLRIVNLLLVADAIKDKEKLYNSIYAQYRFLLKHQEKHLLGNHYLENLKAIVICSIVFEEERVYKKYIQKLIRELEEEITEDGLHFELSLMYHKIVLEDLMRVGVVLETAKKEEYRTIVGYISKMVTALYSLEFGVGRTPLFNDAGEGVSKTTEALLFACKRLFHIVPEQKDSISGYCKLYAGKKTLIADYGALAPEYMAGHAHCDCLSFELFYDEQPVFVNSGTYQYQGKDRAFFRSTRAHNTVVINGHEQSELWGEHRVARRITRVSAQSDKKTLTGEYTNYYGEKHQRSIQFRDNSLEVLDKVTEEGGSKSYLHLAPGLQYIGGKVIGLNSVIRIEPIDSEVTVEDSVCSTTFGCKEENVCLRFTWKNDESIHGYKIIFSEERKDD